MDQYSLIGEGAQHKVYKYNGNENELKSKVIRIRKPKHICNISQQLIFPFNQTQWTKLKRFFVPKLPYKIDNIECEIMDNLFYDVVFAIEIKPKTFLPILSNKQQDKDLCDPKNQRFFMMQLLKAEKKFNKQGKNIYEQSKKEIDSITSKYDPRKFYNGKIENLFDAVIDLQEYPENNYRLFNNQQEITNKIQDFTNEEIASIISETLLIEDNMIQELKQFFQMLQQMNVTVEETKEAWETIQQKNLTQEQFQQIIDNKCDDNELTLLAFKLLTFSSFQALSDLSIIGTFRKYGTGKFIELNNMKIFYEYHIVDCDLKPLNKIDDYSSTIDELLKLKQYYDSLIN